MNTDSGSQQAQRRAAMALTLDPRASLVRTVRLESPFRAWACTLDDFTGGAFSYVSPNCILRRLRLGRYSSVGQEVSILSRHPLGNLTTSPFAYEKLFAPPFDAPPTLAFDNLSETAIGHDVWIGAGVRIKTGITIGNGAIIGAGSVVTKDVPAYAVVGGAPARVIRMRFDDALIERIERIAWWRFDLLGLDLPIDHPAAAIDALERLVSGNDGDPLLPYEPGHYRVWREGTEIKGRPELPGEI